MGLVAQPRLSKTLLGRARACGTIALVFAGLATSLNHTKAARWSSTNTPSTKASERCSGWSTCSTGSAS